MSGFCGFFRLDGRPANEYEIEHMISSGTAGPSNAWQVLSGGTACFATSSGRCTQGAADGLSIVADARLDNNDELSSLVGERGSAFRESDATLLLKAYRRWGSKCVEHLSGDFAFAIWDAANRTIFCARDHFGVKPFYYHASDRLFAFSSQAETLLRCDGVSSTVDRVAIGDYLSGLFDDTERTLRQDIRRLPSAHAIEVGPGHFSMRRYWSLNVDREVRFPRDADYVDGFAELFVRSVQARLRGGKRVATMLSGGLDSSSITCTARHLASPSEPLVTLSATFRSLPECDERPFIGSVHESGAYAPVFVAGDELSPMAALDRFLEAGCEPFQAPNLFLNLELFARARDNGVGIVLDGFDGDTTVSHGTERMTELARSHNWLTLSGEVVAFSRRTEQPLWPLVRHYGYDHGVGTYPVIATARRLARRIRRRLAPRGASAAPRPVVAQLVRPEIALELDVAGRTRAFARSAKPVRFTERESHLRLLSWGVMPYALEVLHRAASLTGVDVRFPFWDRKLVEYCLALPPELKLRNGWTRYVLRRAMEGVLPRSVQWRGSKSNLGPNLRRALASHDGARVQQSLSDKSGEIFAYANFNVVEAARKRIASGNASNDDVIAIWRTVSLSRWLDQTVPSLRGGGGSALDANLGSRLVPVSPTSSRKEVCTHDNEERHDSA